MHCASFAPIAAPTARVLILGSLPGAFSLKMQQYYAQPRNTFWKIMGGLFVFDPALPYETRVAKLEENHVGVWDVCASAFRPGSLDSAIVLTSVIANNFNAFLAGHNDIRAIYFNGQKAAGLYRRLVMPALNSHGRSVPCDSLPSTSPAHAGMPFDEKLRRWSKVRQGLPLVGTQQRRDLTGIGALHGPPVDRRVR